MTNEPFITHHASFITVARDCMKQTLSITRKELTTYFGSPMALIFVGAFLAATLFAFFWVDTFFARGIADVRPLFRWMPVLMIFLRGGADHAPVERGAALRHAGGAADAAGEQGAAGAGQVPGRDGAGGAGAGAHASAAHHRLAAGQPGLGAGDRRLPGCAAAWPPPMPPSASSSPRAPTTRSWR